MPPSPRNADDEWSSDEPS